MMEELDPAVDTTLETEAPPSMDDTMEATLAAIEARDTPEAEVTEEPAAAAQRARDEAGRFARADAAQPKPVADPKAPVQPAGEFQDKGPPQTWRPAAKAMWNNVPPELKAEVYKREQDAMSGIQQYQAKAQVGDALMNVITPYQPIIAALGANIPQALNELLNTAATLHVGTADQKATLLRTMAQRYGVDLTAPANSGNDQFRDPVVDELRRELGQVKGQLAGIRQESQNSEFQVANGEINAFHADPKNKYFPDVAYSMGQLIKAGLASSLPEAYEKACHLNPQVKAALEHEHSLAQEQERARRAAAARRAGDLSVRSVPTPRPVGNPAKSWQDGMEDVFHAIQAREAS